MNLLTAKRWASIIALGVVVLLSVFDPVHDGVAHAAVVAVPDTPAGHMLKEWLDALNGGDRAKMAAYCAKSDEECDADDWMAFRRDTGGGIDLIAIDKSERLHIEFRAKNRGTPEVGFGKLDVTDGHPLRVTSFSLRVIPPGMTTADMKITVDAAARSRILDGIVARLSEFYVYPDAVSKMEQALRAHQKSGDYDAITDGDVFATRLTRQLQGVSHDKHLHVICVPEVLPKEDPKPDRTIPPERRARMEHDNCGFDKVERLESNVGYVKFNFFGPPAVCGPTATAALNFLANVDALIIDLRDNGGGSPDMVSFIASYLFSERTRLNDIYNRKENKTTEYWTKPDVPGKKIIGKPVFVLTSKRTFSAAEDFTYAVKNLKRATIVGETTGGGAHPTRGCRVDDHFLIGVPFARSISTITKTDWEGTGVEPDVKAPADQALDVAKNLAVEALRRKAPLSPNKPL
jgi:retinol-binding protein 3